MADKYQSYAHGANSDVVFNAIITDVEGRTDGWYVITMADANQSMVTTLDSDSDPVGERNRAFEATGALTAARTVTFPDRSGPHYFWNNTTGGFSITVRTVTDATGIVVAAGEKVTFVVEATTFDVRSWTPSVALALNDLTDTNLGSPSDGQSVVWDGGTNKWINSTVDSGLPPGYITGFQLANNATDAANDIDIGTGSLRDTSDTYDVVLSSGLTKQIDAAFAAGTNAGGMATGTVAANTWYHVNAIRKDSDGTIDVCFDTSITGANTPSGYTFMKRLGSVRTNATPAILGFQHLVDKGRFLWNDPPLDQDPASATITTTQASYSISVPPGISVTALLNVYVSHASAQTLVSILNPNVNDEAPSSSAGPLATVRTGASGAFQHAQIDVDTNASNQIAARADNTATVFGVVTLGWEEGPGHGSGQFGDVGSIITVYEKSESAVTTSSFIDGNTDDNGKTIDLNDPDAVYEVEIVRLTVSANSQQPWFLLRNGGSFQTTSYNGRAVSVDQNGSSDVDNADTARINLCADGANYLLGNNSGNSLVATAQLWNMGSTSLHPHVKGAGRMYSNNDVVRLIDFWGSWHGNLNGCDGLELGVDSGTMTVLWRIWKRPKP